LSRLQSNDPTTWGQTVILGRTRSLLVPIQQALASCGVKAVIAQRRDRFISPQFTWLQACLDQSLCPTDARTFKVLVDSANRVTGQDLDLAILAAEAVAAGVAYFEHWGKTSIALGNPIGATLGGFAVRLAESRNSWRQIVREAISILTNSATSAEGVVSDAADDKAAWESCVKEIRAEKGGTSNSTSLFKGWPCDLRNRHAMQLPSLCSLFMPQRVSNSIQCMSSDLLNRSCRLGKASAKATSRQKWKRSDETASSPLHVLAKL